VSIAKPTMTYEIARVIAADTGNNQMRLNQRTVWNEEDYNLACRTLARLFPACGAKRQAGLAKSIN